MDDHLSVPDPMRARIDARWGIIMDPACARIHYARTGFYPTIKMEMEHTRVQVHMNDATTVKVHFTAAATSRYKNPVQTGLEEVKCELNNLQMVPIAQTVDAVIAGRYEVTLMLASPAPKMLEILQFVAEKLHKLENLQPSQLESLSRTFENECRIERAPFMDIEDAVITTLDKLESLCVAVAPPPVIRIYGDLVHSEEAKQAVRELHAQLYPGCVVVFHDEYDGATECDSDVE